MTILKKPQEDLINWYLPFTTPIHHRSVMLMSCMTQSCNIRAIGSDKAVATPKIEFSSCSVTFWGNVFSFRYDELDVVWRFSFLVVALNFVKWIQNYCHQIKFHTVFLSPYRIGCHSVGLYLFVFDSALKFLLWIRQLLFQQLENFLFSSISHLLSFNFCIARQNSTLAKE